MCVVVVVIVAIVIDIVNDGTAPISAVDVIIDNAQTSLSSNTASITNIENVLIEKDSKRSSKQWAGRTDSNKWVIFDKKSERIGDIVPVKIKSAFGITLQGEIKKIQEMETVI